MNEVLEYRLRTAARHTVWGLRDLAARPTAHLRSFPDYLIVGAQRCGTTTLQGLLAAHPDVRPPMLRKGIHYFDTSYHRSPNWYRSQFPVRGNADRVLTGEASPYYLFHPAVPKRITELLDRVKVIALLRDPTERAISHHKHEVRRGFEELELADALAAEEDRLAGEEERLLTTPGYNSFNHQHYSYRSRGLYAGQLSRYLEVMDPDRILVLQSETFWQEPHDTFSRVQSFLGLSSWAPESIPRLNATSPRNADDVIRRRLADRFAESNHELVSRWGVGEGWL